MRGEYSAAWGPLEALQGTFNWILRAAAVLLVLITGYYIYGILFKSNELFRAATESGQFLSQSDFLRQLGTMELLTKVLLVASVMGILAAVARYYALPETGVALLAIGGALFLGVPFLIDNFGGPEGGLKPALLKLGDPRVYLKARFALAGLLFLVSGGIYLMAHALCLATGVSRRRPRANADAAKTAQQVRKSRDVFLGPCWDLPFCRDTEKKLCPIRKERRACWIKGRGCYCDQNVILQLSGGSQYAASSGTSGYLSRVASTVARPKTRAEKRDQCLQCPVYLHHQAQKYKLLAPGALLGIAAFFALNWLALTTQLYPDAITRLGKAAGGLSFGPSAGGTPTWATDMAHNPTTMYLLFAVVIVMCLSYVLHGVEWALYRLGI